MLCENAKRQEKAFSVVELFRIGMKRGEKSILINEHQANFEVGRSIIKVTMQNVHEKTSFNALIVIVCCLCKYTQSAGEQQNNIIPSPLLCIFTWIANKIKRKSTERISPFTYNSQRLRFSNFIF